MWLWVTVVQWIFLAIKRLNGFGIYYSDFSLPFVCPCGSHILPNWWSIWCIQREWIFLVWPTSTCFPLVSDFLNFCTKSIGNFPLVHSKSWKRFLSALTIKSSHILHQICTCRGNFRQMVGKWKCQEKSLFTQIDSQVQICTNL